MNKESLLYAELNPKERWYWDNRENIRAREQTREYKDFRNSRISLKKELTKLKALLNKKKITLDVKKQLEKCYYILKSTESLKSQYKLNVVRALKD